MEGTTEKSEVVVQKVSQPGKVSAFVWFPFFLVFLLAFAIVILSFLESTPWDESMPVKILKFQNENGRLILLSVLLIISLIIPFWAYSLARPRENDGPLGLPAGSIRAVVVLMAAIAYAILTVKGNALDDARNIFILIAILYFFSRK